MERKIESDDNTCFVREVAELDMVTTGEAKAAWSNLIEQGFHLVLDLSETTLVQAETIRAMIAINNEAKDKGVRCVMIASREVERTISLLPITRSYLPPIVATREEAVKAIAR